MAITLAVAQAHLDTWLAADLAVAEGQSVSVDTTAGSRSLSLVDSKEIRENIKYWRGKVQSLEDQAAGLPEGTIRLATWS